MISTEEENSAVQCLHDFIYYFNKKDKSKILNCLHYPHMAQSDNNDPTIYKNEEEMWGYIGFLLKKLEKEENWNKSTLDKVEVINKSENAVQCLVCNSWAFFSLAFKCLASPASFGGPVKFGLFLGSSWCTLTAKPARTKLSLT